MYNLNYTKKILPKLQILNHFLEFQHFFPVISIEKKRLHVAGEQGREHEQRPQANDDARYGREQLDQGGHHAGDLAGHQL